MHLMDLFTFVWMTVSLVCLVSIALKLSRIERHLALMEGASSRKGSEGRDGISPRRGERE